MRKLKQKKGVENAHAEDMKEKNSSRQISAHDEEEAKTDDDTDRLYCLFSVGFLSRILRPFLVFWAFSHFLERFFGTAGRNIAYVIIIAIFAFLLIASSVIVDRTLEKSSDVLPDWACKSLRSKVSDKALRMLNIKTEDEDKLK